ncbi:MAG: protein kinase family protein with domain [Acidimicrobiales bacterium]|nr:protein kinase family protein with domain [Acidimicrobiales bacterium]
MTAEIGRVLGGRYRLVAPIGMGASAQVYLADDVKLRRRVALKMLHDALAGDAEFLRRFRAEARAAAALSHPNVMAVYDWGDGDVAFIVTEYLPGGSLRALLDGGNQLSPAQALGVGLEAARALDYAHRRGFVHRDIKPANLLFGEEQRLRIADFGLARALAEAAWTEPQGAVLGTARYASPEQAKGEKLSGKADVYSLALVLVEAVSGEVPFVADTTLGTLMARVDKPLPVPDSLGPLQAVLARAGHPDPAQRIDARALATGLLRAAKVLSRPAPLPLAGALSPLGEITVDADPTIHAPGPLAVPPVSGSDAAGSTMASPSDLTSDDLELGPPSWVNQAAGLLVDEPDHDETVDPVDATDATDAPDATDEPDESDEPDGSGPDEPVETGAAPTVDALDLTDAALATPTWADATAAEPDPADRIVAPSAAAVPVPIPVPGATTVLAPPAALTRSEPLEIDDLPPDEPRGRRRWPWVLLVVALLAGGGGVAAAAVAGRDSGGTPVRVISLPVPTLAGRTETQARQLIDAAGWNVSIDRVRRDGTRKGQVLDSKPAAGGRLPAGRTITLTVSEGQTIVAVPAGLVGVPTAAATTALEAVGLKATVADTAYDEDRAKGVVTSLAAGTKPQLEKGSAVGLIVSNGPRPRIVPSGLRGSTVAAATEALHAVQLEIATTNAFSSDVPKGQIISVLPATGASVPRGSTVTVEVSKGPELVSVPNVKRASSLSEAIALLKAAGFKAGSVSGPADGKPKRTDPAAGTKVPKGSSVDIVLG